MGPNRIKSKDYFRALTILHSALLIGIILFAGIVTFLVHTGSAVNDTDLHQPLQYLLPVITVICIASAFLFFNNRMHLVRLNPGLYEKTMEYRGALILKYAFFDGAAIFSIISVFLTGFTGFFLYTAVMGALLFVSRPAVQSTINDLQLNEADAAVLEDPEGIIE
jgi:hypothetical protein